LNDRIEALEDQVDALHAELRRKDREVTQYMQQLDSVFASRSWRITKPIRAVSRFSRALAERASWLASDGYERLPTALRSRLCGVVQHLSRRPAKSHGVGEGRLPPSQYDLAISAFTEAPPKSIAFPESREPRISIVVVGVTTEREEVLRTLASLRAQRGIEAVEVIVIAPDVSKLSPSLSGVRLESGTQSLAENYARGAALARSPWIIFLTAGCCPFAGALTEVQKLVQEQKDAGVLVPKLVGADGRLAFPLLAPEATDPNAPEVGFMRRAERCPAAAFAVRRALVGSPASVLEVRAGSMATLVDATRQQGASVLYLPSMHALVPRRLVTRDPVRPFGDPAHAASHVLVLDQHTPTPDRDSGSVDAYFQMKILVELGYRVTFFATVDADDRSPYTLDLQRIGVECLYPPYTTSIAEHLRRHGMRYEYVVLSRLPVAHDLLDIVRRHCRRAVVVFNTVDLHFLREQRQAELTADPIIAQRARQTRRQELTLMRKADATWVISEAEAALLAQHAPSVRTFSLPLIMDISDRIETPFAERKDLFFIGGFRHAPNRDAVQHFLRAIWPRVRDRLDGVRFHVVGSDVPPETLALAASDTVFHGYVPDAARFFNGCRLSVAPLRFGAGMKGKVGRSLGYGCPVVLSPVAAEGIRLTDGNEALIASDDGEFADAVVRLYQDQALWHRLSREGRRFFDAHFSYDVGKARLAAIFDALERPAARAEST
jgi:glycosyltransferase involved in cell wall biosynthesis